MDQVTIPLNLYKQLLKERHLLSKLDDLCHDTHILLSKALSDTLSDEVYLKGVKEIDEKHYVDFE